jgi:hypothetical protein
MHRDTFWRVVGFNSSSEYLRVISCVKQKVAFNYVLHNKKRYLPI